MLYNFVNSEAVTEYYSLISLAKSRTTPSVFERHHVIPKSLGGSNSAENLVNLSPKEHLRAHELLVDMTEGAAKSKMIYAHWMMATVSNEHQHRELLTPDKFEAAKKLRKTIDTLQSTRDKISSSRKGKCAIFNQVLGIVKYISPEDIELYSESGYVLGGRPKSDSCKDKISKTNLAKGIKPKSIGWNTGMTKDTDARVAKISKTLTGKPAWNKGLSNTGFGAPGATNPMQDPEKINKMLESRKKNKNDKR
jgi:hypothetical protein